MTLNVELFKHDQFGQLRAVEVNGGVEFIATDLAKMLGQNSAKDLTRLLDEDEKGRHIVPTPGGEQELSTVTEAGFYRAVMLRRTACIKDNDKRAAVAGIQRWVTHEVLPSIRKHGGYIAGQENMTPEQVVANALVVAQGIIQHKEVQIAELAPKAFFADAVANSGTLILIRDMAKILKQNGFDIGGNRLFDQLREDGYLEKHRNEPMQRSLELGIMRVVENTVTKPDGTTFVTRTPKITGKGQAYFVKRYCKAEAVA
ncbi:MAG: phage antirepressor KilAC domain-containing protein [Gordonibacter sp.]|uniref:phage antirepressor n=1 Tax=Gordonibacter sp. TaxID=1968902 RepID=UPI002FC5F2BA